MCGIIEIHAQDATSHLLWLQLGNRRELAKLHARRQLLLPHANTGELLFAAILELQLNGAHCRRVEMRCTGEAIRQLQPMAGDLVEQLLVLVLCVRRSHELDAIVRLLRLQCQLAGLHGDAWKGS